MHYVSLKNIHILKEPVFIKQFIKYFGDVETYELSATIKMCIQIKIKSLIFLIFKCSYYFTPIILLMVSLIILLMRN